MARRKRSAVELAAQRQLSTVVLREGAKIRAARKRRKWTQNELGRLAGFAQPTISDFELGRAGALSLESWQQVALVLGLPLELTLGRDALEEPADAGHLRIQELVLRCARPHGFADTFELPSRPTNPSLSTDVGLRDDRRRLLIQVECVNTFGKVNEAVRSSDRKRAEAEEVAVAVGHGEEYRVRQVWVIRATRRNREIVAAYPHIFESRFRGPSRAWVDALTKATDAPLEAGLIWCDVACTRLFAWRTNRRA
jgi:transcriptional regulator with XRE-family HTH domain